MDFIDELKQFSKRVEALKDKLQTEEATKSSLIMPFFAMLGYDVFNPDEFTPEFTADVGIKKGEKVDYAILSDGAPMILIEAKCVKEDLKKHDSQLFRYFGTTDAKFAILTNGIIYRFYTDLDEPNKMDAVPFLEINVLDIKESQVKELKKFSKAAFSVETILDTASHLKYTHEFRKVFLNELQNPSDDFVRHFLHGVYTGQKTAAVIEKFRPIIKDALNQTISETMNDKIKAALGVKGLVETPSQASEAEPVEPEQTETQKKEKIILTTEEELEAYFIVKNILKPVISFDRISYKDNERYMSINIDEKTTKWVCRLYFNGAKKYLTYPNEQKKEIRVDIENIYDIESVSAQLLEVANRFV